MGNEKSKGVHSDNFQPDMQTKHYLENLPRVFSKHYNDVVGFSEATIAQQKLVDELEQLSKDEGATDTPGQRVFNAGRDILKNIQVKKQYMCFFRSEVAGERKFKVQMINIADRGINKYISLYSILQAARYTQTMTLHETVMELYHNIQGNLKSVGEEPFEIVSPQQIKNYHQSNYAVNIQNRENLSDEATNKSMVKQLTEQLRKDIDDLKCDLEKKNSIIGQLTESENAQIKRLQQLAMENENLKEKLEKLKPPKISSTIQNFHSHHGKSIHDIEEELRKMLKNQMNGISFMHLSRHAEIDTSEMLIVLCIITSRVGTDAATAIRYIKNPAKTALVLIHVKEGHPLSNHMSTSILTDGKFKDLGGIFDLGYVFEKGIYSCAMNDVALDGICKYIKSNMSKKH